ncbi:unnamed protein product [Pleuronectes platessa]|uniref:Uncharacterized protein n=1 Tax=Pleuronectes platessa TaxID=8262 RepID=A0A9N7VSK9_PLEPL|nr:unnamed protein product [Pleuronectes platessa]
MIDTPVAMTDQSETQDVGLLSSPLLSSPALLCFRDRERLSPQGERRQDPVPPQSDHLRSDFPTTTLSTSSCDTGVLTVVRLPIHKNESELGYIATRPKDC